MGSPESPDTPGPDDANNDRILATNHLYINNGDSDNDDEDRPNEGYEPLPISNDENEIEIMTTSLSESDESDDEEIDLEATQPVFNDSILPNVISSEPETDVWNEPRPKELEIHLDSSKSEEIMSVMSSITLPTINIPIWAKSVPEEKWKTELLEKIRQKKGITD